MLDITSEDYAAIVQSIACEEGVFCDICGYEAFIFQEEGSFCLNCWQAWTEPNI